MRKIVPHTLRSDVKHEDAISRASTSSRPTYDFSGIWLNELGSRMELVQDGDQLTGTYTSPVSQGGGTATGALVGWVSGLLIAVTVRWDSYAALTSWVGQVVEPSGLPDAIEALWQMTNAIPDPSQPGELWQSVLAGADEFHREG
jgi:hypothetical protein